MANHKSAIKRHKQSLKKRETNRVQRATVRTEIKKVKSAIEEGKADVAVSLLKQAESQLAKSAAKGILHKKNASRRISRLARSLNASKKK